MAVCTVLCTAQQGLRNLKCQGGTGGVERRGAAARNGGFEKRVAGGKECRVLRILGRS